MDVEIRHARIVAAIAQSGSISRAAAELSLPQPSLTNQLRRIERVVGGRLFVRSRSGVIPTPLGERVIPMLGDIVRRYDAVLVEAKAPTPLVVLGSTDWTVPGLTQAIESELPGTEIQTITVASSAVHEDVEAGVLTAAVVTYADVPEAPDPPTGHLSTALIASEPVWLLLPVDHPVAQVDPIEAKQLELLRWVRRAPGTWFSVVEAHLFDRLGMDHPGVAHRAGSSAEAVAWVAGAGTATFAPPTSILAAGPDAQSRVVALPLTESVRVDHLLLWQSTAMDPHLSAALLRALQRQHAAAARQLPRYWAHLRNGGDVKPAPEAR